MVTGMLVSMAMAASCVVEDAAPWTEQHAASTTNPAVEFRADWSVVTTGHLWRGTQLQIHYAPERASCTGDLPTGPGWSVTGFYRWNGGAATSFWVAGRQPAPELAAPSIALDRVGELEIWFQNNNRWGCNAYDSNFGQNYKFSVAAGPHGPSWVGDARYSIERMTCNGAVCPQSWRSLENGFFYETWARQRAALRQAGFQVWQPGVTDWDNPDLWQQLDTQVHYRYAGQADFATQYVNFDGRWGNNAHYAIDLRAFDPFEWPRGAGITTAADCPPLALRRDATGYYVETDFEFYFTVNGVELRPTAGGAFKGTYQDYLGNFAVCTAPQL